ncbi:uncharacterized protein CELE_C25G4.7 [Caenorhabditis elegans]|uniref:Uncharacterized protein n=1 Tax=Caenorhabditis elegans TaxID=6239 RepID=C6KRL0_CAEEL|nr:Uncharacterized protein CELE_C25G4.7 [Caenorhabditis elegans]CAZ65469.1 Uncharacterized protein CELE_C25G4.7 [Caenorhabditis elegans]|eukprot:NP_001255648.1 Uncharacterized protein CELE_C25G4.7 [Caenorhabditis elegans]
MSKPESVQESLDTITFIHSFQITTTKVEHMKPKRFTTVHQYSLINW